jgi:polysaccharide export outer membrane protein
VGLAPPQVEQAIIRQLTGKAIEPQALVTVTSAVSNSATVTGEVTQGGRVPLTTRGDRILDVIAVAGGVRAPVHETFITLHRNGRAATVPMQTLLQNPRENINVRPADVLTLVRTPQTFSVFGATGRNAVVPFDAVGLSVEEAVAKSGGLIGLEADPEGVFLLRREPAKLVRALAPQHPIGAGEELVNVVYRINLRDANTYFLARRMAVFNKDMLYVAPAMAVEARKLLELFNVGASTLSNAAITRLYLRQ